MKGKGLLSARTPAASAGPLLNPGVYSLRTDECRIEFSVRHMMLATARGTLSPCDGSLLVDAGDHLASRVDVQLAAASVATGSSELDELLRGPDFLDVERFPVIRFESFDVVEIRPTRFKVWGDLYIKDLVGDVPLQTRLVAAGPDVVTFAAATAFSRRAFGLT